MSQSSDRLMTTGGDTSDGRCEDHDMSPSSDRLMTTGGDTSDGRCEEFKNRRTKVNILIEFMIKRDRESHRIHD